eukprot:5082514-Prymnesium_polylepis.1
MACVGIGRAGWAPVVPQSAPCTHSGPCATVQRRGDCRRLRLRRAGWHECTIRGALGSTFYSVKVPMAHGS